MINGSFKATPAPDADAREIQNEIDYLAGITPEDWRKAEFKLLKLSAGAKVICTGFTPGAPEADPLSDILKDMQKEYNAAVAAEGKNLPSASYVLMKTREKITAAQKDPAYDPERLFRLRRIESRTLSQITHRRERPQQATR